MFGAMAYSMDLRERVARAHAESGSSAEVAETFGCSESWVRRLTQRLRETGSLAARSTARTDDQRAFDGADEAKIRALIRERPDATLAEVAEAIGKPACPGTVSRTLKRLKLPRKKSRRTRPSGTAPTS
jgi:transposase